MTCCASTSNTWWSLLLVLLLALGQVGKCRHLAGCLIRSDEARKFNLSGLSIVILAKAEIEIVENFADNKIVLVILPIVTIQFVGTDLAFAI